MKKKSLFLVILFLIVGSTVWAVYLFHHPAEDQKKPEANATDTMEQAPSDDGNNTSSKQDERTKERNEIYKTTAADLTEEERAEIQVESQFLQESYGETISGKTADTLAEYFVRCLRIETEDSPKKILQARYEASEQNRWEYWILTSSAGIEYWLEGYTIKNAFDVYFVYRGSREGECIYGVFE